MCIHFCTKSSMPRAEKIGCITNPYFSGFHVMDIEKFSQSIHLNLLDHKHLRADGSFPKFYEGGS